MWVIWIKISVQLNPLNNIEIKKLDLMPLFSKDDLSRIKNGMS